MGQRQFRRLRRARRVRVGIGVGVTVAVLAGLGAIFVTTNLSGDEAVASGSPAALVGVPAARTSLTRTLARTKQRTQREVTVRRAAPVVPAVPPAPAVKPTDHPSFPLPPNSGTGRRVVFCNSCARVWLVEANGFVTASYIVSGHRNYPRPGMYKVIRRVNPGWSHTLRLPYFVGFTYGNTTDVGFHGIPLRPNGTQIENDSQLGQYLSHGCVRESQPMAKLMWDWAPMGTPVVVLR